MASFDNDPELCQKSLKRKIEVLAAGMSVIRFASRSNNRAFYICGVGVDIASERSIKIEPKGS